MRCPCVEVVRKRDCSAGPLVPAYGYVLVEGRRALDRGLVSTSGLVDVVGGTIGGDGADGGTGRSSRVIFLDVVFDERTGGPAVDGEQRRAGRGGEGPLVSDGSARGVKNMTQTITVVTFWASSYLAAPVFQPRPTTKSAALEYVSEYPLVVAVKSTFPPV